MQTKICSKCGRELSLDNFYKKKRGKYGVCGECKDCYNSRSKEYQENNKEKINLYMKEYREKNKEKEKLYREKNREKRSLYHKEYYKNKKEAINKKASEYQKKRLKEDELFSFTHRVRGLIRDSVSCRKGYTKKSKTQEIVGCTFEQLKEHLENTWYNNYGTPYNGEPVHIDHIIPLSYAKNEEDVIKLCHYTNLQYLKPEDNLKKSDKLDYVL